MLKYPANANLGRKLIRKQLRSRCDVKRKTEVGWVTIYQAEPVLVSDSSDRPPRPDPWDAGSDNVRTWNIGFRLGVDVRMQDQLHNIVIRGTGEPLPILTVATDFQTDNQTASWVVAHAEDSAVEKVVISFLREHEDGTSSTIGPYLMTVDWEDVAGTDPSNYAATAHFTTAVLTVNLIDYPDFDVRNGDYTSKVDGRFGMVIETRRRIAGRMEVRARFDAGTRQ